MRKQSLYNDEKTYISLYFKNACRIISIFSLIFLFPNWAVFAADNPKMPSFSLKFQDFSPEIRDRLTNICEKVANVELPNKDRPSPDAAKALLNCDSEKLYYGIGITPDPVKARECAMLELNKEQDAFNGYSMLMMIYANGKGAERNLDLALKIACNDVEGSEAELQFRIEHLAKLKAENWQGNDFSVCDDITSGLMSGVCSAHEARISDAKRNEELSTITSKWSSKDKKAFEKLNKAADAFIEARSTNEIDQSGTARGQFVNDEMQALLNDFQSAIQNFEQGKFPKFSANDFSESDKKLNKIYNDLLVKMKSNSKENFTTIQPEGVIATQKLWLKYRDAWVQFAHIKYPGFDDNSIKTWLTNKRIKMLEEISSYF